MKRNPSRKWIAYIAKVGHKWYPIESITEYLLNQIGEVLGLNIAKSRLAILGDQLFFLSEYFLNHKQYELVHGVDIYSGYINDKELVEEIEKKALAREFFTFQFAEKAIQEAFPEHANDLLAAFVKMLFFDAIVGNNDRHFYNWAVLRHIENAISPTFSPIFDTARGLFWNQSEPKVMERYRHHNTLDEFIVKYAEKSMPKTGWEGQTELNHFQLVEMLVGYSPVYADILCMLTNQNRENDVITLIDTKFVTLLSKERRHLINKCLHYRFQKLRSFLNR